MKVLIDVGGSGVRFATCGILKKNIEIKQCKKNIGSIEEFVRVIKKVSNGRHVEGIAISAAGFVDSKNGVVLQSNQARYLMVEGWLANRLKKDFPFSKVAVVNDGEAHARALIYRNAHVKPVKFGAIHVAFGTSVSFGVINEKGKIIRACNGGNWDIGNLELRTSEDEHEVWVILGRGDTDWRPKHGLEKLKSEKSNPYLHFGWRAGSFLKNMATVFRPRSIGISGGIVEDHKNDIMQGIRDCFRDPVGWKEYEKESPVEFVVLDYSNAVMEGLTTLL